MSNILMCGNEPLGLLQGNASDISFDNSGGGILSDNVQDAIEEINDKIPDISTKVSKSGDTMTGDLTINKTNTGTTNVSSVLRLGNNIPVGTAGTSRGVINFYGKGSNLTQLIAETISADRQVLLPDKSGTMALFEDFNSTSLLANAYFPTGGQWSSAIQLSDDINNYVYLGFAWAGADNQYLSGLIEKIIDVGNFKGFKQSNPLSIWNYPISPSDSKSILVAYYDATHIQVYRGSEMYQYNRLWVTGLIKK